ncbi:Piwi domain-containing protein [Phellopilus nigrolimitatus]|nr:Piwi domain-containing protein [Phellopilus nigrolimitatus]
MAYYDYYRGGPNWATAQWQSMVPPTPSFQPQPSWGGLDFFRARSGLADTALYNSAWSRVQSVQDAAGIGPSLVEAKRLHRRAYGGLGDILAMVPADIGAAAAYEVWRNWRYHYGILAQPLSGDEERQREALIGLAVGEGVVQSLIFASNMRMTCPWSMWETRLRILLSPAELCKIEPSQPFAGVLSGSEAAGMTKFSTNPPYVDAKMITEHDLEVFVMYLSGSLTVANGSWNTRDVRFHRPAQLTRAAILVLADGGREDFSDSSDPALRGVVARLLATCRAGGMQVDDAFPPLLFVRLPQTNPRDPLRSAAIDAIENEIKTLPGRANIVLVFVSNNGIYPDLKKLCDSKLGIATVCMQMANFRKERGQNQYLSRIALKVNTKLGGVNHQLDASSMRWLKNMMLVGMDLTRPGVGCVMGTPSIAAVVASCDEEFMYYPASLDLQGIGKEASNLMKSLPERVVVFRGGVSDGQFKHILTHELPEIKAAFRSFKAYSPKLTIVICGKRHRTRFYPTRPEQADKTSNTKAGTLVDRGVTAVSNFNFFLQAHAGQQGTVRATHYTVIFDENRLLADDIQQGAHNTSYLWVPATKSVRLVSPAYVDLAMYIWQDDTF